jgi:hypothetical protein
MEWNVGSEVKGRAQTKSVYEMDNIWIQKGRINEILYKVAQTTIYSLCMIESRVVKLAVMLSHGTDGKCAQKPSPATPIPTRRRQYQSTV